MKRTVIKDFGNIKVYSNVSGSVEMTSKELAESVFEYEFLLHWDMEEAAAADSKLSIVWDLPCVDVQYMWHPDCRPKRVLDANWRLKLSSMLTGSAPVACLFNGADQNTYTFAADEIKKVMSVQFGVEDSRNTITGEISMGLKQFTGQSEHRLRVYGDFRRIPYYESLDCVRAWWESVCAIDPMAVPEAARLPMYSSWYNFHQEITDSELEEECRRAVKLGMKSIIVDDGWQTLDTNSGYGYCGDWEVCTKKISNMREHVKRVHEAGLKYILWYSVPFVGFHSKNWGRFQNKILCTVDRNETGVLDPRFPDVREFLCGIYENALREYDLDGFKLDFIDQFTMRENDTIRGEMDYTCVQEATERLMTDIMLRLKAIKSDIMIEFRQRYIGPGMRKFGNIFRVSDCPSDITTNRIGTVDLRLLSGNTAVHSDMLTWNEAETPEDAALQILNVLFGVIQFSKNIGNMGDAHKRMSAFWLDFAVKNEKILLESKLIPYEPQYLYPVITAKNEEEAITGVYERSRIIFIETALNRNQVINATKEEVLYLSFDMPCRADVAVYDCFGKLILEKEMMFEKGLVMAAVPRSGLIEIKRIDEAN